MVFLKGGVWSELSFVSVFFGQSCLSFKGGVCSEWSCSRVVFGQSCRS